MNQQNDPQNVSNNALPTSTLAIISLVAAILGFTMLPIIGSIVAIVTGYSARKETRAVPALVGGDGLATAGIIMGWIQVGLVVVGTCCFAAYFVFILGAVGLSNN
jgi:4-hydroxybenzoate polyprenyltransferase